MLSRAAARIGAVRGWAWLDIVEARLWPVIFVFMLLSAAVIQIVLPPLLPSWFHPGTGMIMGTDSSENDEASRLLAGQIVTGGWSAWTAQAVTPVKVGSALYALFWPKAWVVIPLSAAVFATAAFALFTIVAIVSGERRIAVLSILPFVLFPSNVTWSTQMLRDGFSIGGVLLLVLGWVLALRGAGGRSLLMAAVLVVAGAIASGSRGVNAQATLLAVALGTALFTGAVIVAAISQRHVRRQAALGAAGAWCAVAIAFPFVTGGRPIDSESLPLPSNASSVAEDTWSASRAGLTSDPEGRLTSFWVASPALPDRIDSALHAMALSRAGFLLIYPEAASNIDLDQRPGDARAVVSYLPRATQIGFLAPFPSHWIERGRSQSTTVGRRISGIEMGAVYIAMAMLPIGAWHFRRNILFWSVMTACTSVIVLLGFVVSNIGALHRMRYPYLAIFASLALAAGLSAVADRSR